jgi:hypothetical protein
MIRILSAGKGFMQGFERKRTAESLATKSTAEPTPEPALLQNAMSD